MIPNRKRRRVRFQISIIILRVAGYVGSAEPTRQFHDREGDIGRLPPRRQISVFRCQH